MRLDDILTTITSHSITIAKLGDSSINITDCQETTWTTLESNPEHSIFWFIADPFVKPTLVHFEPVTILCIKETKIEPIRRCYPNATIILAATLQQFEEIKQVVRNSLHMNYVALERLSEAYHAVFSGANFQKLSEIGSAIFGNPIFILDNLGNYIAFPPFQQDEETILQQERQRGYILASDLSELKRLKVDQILQETEKAYLFENPILNHQTLVDFIRLNGSVLGRLMTYDKNKPLTEGDRIVFMHFARIVALAFSQDKNYLMNKDAPYSYFLQSLLNREYNTPVMGNTQLEELGLHVQHYKRVLSVHFLNPDITENNRLVIAQQLKKLLGNALFMFHENRLIFLASGLQKDFLQAKVCELLDFCQISQIRLSASHIFYDFSQFRQLYHQALQVEQLVQKYQLNGSLFSYRYMNSLIMLDSHRTHQTSFIHPDILELLEYDKQKNNQLLITLATYILFNQDTEEISNYLYVHPNTLRYRIKKIKTILQNNLTDWLLLKTYYDSLVQLFQLGEISNQDLIIRNDRYFL
ncbi:PucR family transcriptional regulator [Streptococcus moroccensis]|uniref:PucR C-terminal helix-turn-helix domain-containing protein n=1 Tax=Streptococcus moroccensis TaxID=1451356 RepID=A0ABT9YQR4_9STRE|nr:helix-turn-helix domain-containing protein [Streptococcus moroccensis]MDQ0222343.1 hypothetical protein [Streptococcus moroccensis]